MTIVAVIDEGKPGRRRFMQRTRLLLGAVVSALLVWFAVDNYVRSKPIAEENLRGLALSLALAIEKIASSDDSFRTLSNFRTDDIAYYAIITGSGEYLFHSNADLIGTTIGGGTDFGTILSERIMTERRVTLGTGEQVFELSTPIELSHNRALLRLILHTYRADSVVRRARLNLLFMISLVAVGWVMAAILFRLGKREELLQREMIRRDNLAKLGEMGAVLAHEIRNPLAGIKGYAQVIEKRPNEPRNGNFAAQIITEVLRLEELVSELLLYASASSPAISDYYLDRVIEQAVAMVRHEAGQAGVHISVTCPEGVVLQGNSDRIGQILLNLAKNAVQAMPDGGDLVIEAREQKNVVHIAVRDTGIGIQEDEMQRIFEPFFTTKARGTGLGLSLCKKIAEEHGGDISVASAPGAGTTVALSLPCQGCASRNVRSQL